jgi:hypothetical protein
VRHQRPMNTNGMQIGLAFIVTGLLVYAYSGRPSPAAPTAETMNAHVAQSGDAQGQPSASAATLDPHNIFFFIASWRSEHFPK